MEQKPRDKYPKAKIEEPNLRLPKALLKPDGDPTDDLAYMKIFVSFCCYNWFPIDMQLVKFIGKDFEGMSEVHRASKATIGILADAESNLHSHSYIDLVGTVEQVTTAEGLILDNTLKTYSTLAYPVILMPPTIYGDYIIIPVQKVIHVLGSYGTNILRMEMESGAWIKIEPGAPPGGSEKDRLINVFGPREHVNKAIKLIRAVTYEPSEPAEAQEELWREFNEPCWREFFERKESEEATLKEYSGEPEKGKQQAEEGGSGGPEKEKQQEYVDSGVLIDGKKSGDGESEKNKSKKPNWSQVVERKKSVSGESENKFKERKTIIRIKKSGGGEGSKSEKEKKEGGWNRIFLRKKSPSEGSKRTEGEFKEPSWSQTFGHMKSEGDNPTEEPKDKDSGESGKGKQAEEGGSGQTEKEKQPEHVDEKEGGESKEKRQEDVDQEADSIESEMEKEGDSGVTEKQKQ
ncbi:hypothetical protein L2E82_36584 [Cichorium intybus]|uniref:Uncharacterized protein n=1 Tax=Cichorium intybus TaxID=13427 RepID=A0ACB9ADR4_CICIN|nr:hypothetical protein L2E82_36584 [Cichorium intybus]